MNEDKTKIVQWIQEHEEELIAFLKKLVQTASDNPAGDCLPIARVLEKQLSGLGFEQVSLLPVDEESVKANGMISMANVLATTEFGEGTNVVLNAHGDVVPPGLGWSVDPYGGEIVDGKMYGRGVAVSKSDIAAYTFAVLALKQVGAKLSGRVDLAFTFDEETGGEIGPRRLIDQGYIKPDQAIVAGFTYSAVNAHNGCLHFEIKTTGKSAHAALPHTGIDAIEATTKILQVLYDYRKILAEKKSQVPGIDFPTLNVGLITGGINTNVVPDECTIRVDRRLIPEEDFVRAESEFREMVHQAVSEIPGIKVEIKKILHAKSFGPVPENTRLIQALGANWRSILQEDGELPVHGVPLYTDARHFFAAGIPTIMFGVGPKVLEDANGHRADENIRLSDLQAAAKIVACTLYDLLVR
ncbi:ArgE/DapE family deacylase [Neobacillus niacini]|uniref:ArgE/DapE family deacylase n=1 Tax=Neobacillus niacini TaxID=86668 RepID=UPI00052F4CDD|nr:ArgE/DapE family deacylase [Neobacillus niacini]KGM46457.1 peptidase M20 [Neobacillus niacini]MEC1524324.1 ArgE/DapE family deacylase [Neobacillus niacini]